MTNPPDGKPISLRASVNGSKLDPTVLLEVLGSNKPKVGDDIEIAFVDGSIAHAAVVFLNSYNFPVIDFRGDRFTLVPSGRTGDPDAWTGTRWLVT